MIDLYCWMCGRLFNISNLTEYRAGVYLCRNCFFKTGGGEPPQTKAKEVKK